MFELLLVAAAIAGLFGLALLPATWGLYGGASVTVLSLVVGTVAGIGYHVLLARALRGQLPPSWWWNPTSHHDQLDTDQRPQVMRWFRVGAAGFFGCILGLAMAIAGLFKAV